MFLKTQISLTLTSGGTLGPTLRIVYSKCPTLGSGVNKVEAVAYTGRPPAVLEGVAGVLTSTLPFPFMAAISGSHSGSQKTRQIAAALFFLMHFDEIHLVKVRGSNEK